MVPWRSRCPASDMPVVGCRIRCTRAGRQRKRAGDVGEVTTKPADTGQVEARSGFCDSGMRKNTKLMRDHRI